MLHITWDDKVPNNEVLSRCGCDSMYTTVAERTLRWAGHMQRMPEERLPKAVFYSELAEGARPVGRPKKRYTPGEFETLADDRSGWRQTVRSGTKLYEESI